MVVLIWEKSFYPKGDPSSFKYPPVACTGFLEGFLCLTMSTQVRIHSYTTSVHPTNCDRRTSDDDFQGVTVFPKPGGFNRQPGKSL